MADVLSPSEIARQFGTEDGDLSMFQHQMINFLEAAVVFLLLTNAFSALMANRAMQLLRQHADVTRGPARVERRLNGILGLSA